MLTVEELVNIGYIPDESEISLKLYIDFYEKYLCKKIFVVTLYNDEKVKLFFKDTTEIYHVSGIEHIYHSIPMNATKFVEEVKKGNIDFSTLDSTNHRAYIDYKDRIRSFACIDTIIKNSEYLWYPTGRIPGCSVKVSYLLLKAIDGKNLHLGIDTYKTDRPYFLKTLLVTERNSINKFVSIANDRIKVATIEILDKETNEVLELIDRKKATEVCNKLIKGIIEEWQNLDLDKIVRDFYVDKFKKIDNHEWKKIVASILDKQDTIILNRMLINILAQKEIGDYINEYNTADSREQMEWRELILSDVEEKVGNVSNWISIISDTIYEIATEDIDRIINSLKSQCCKKTLIPLLVKKLESSKLELKNKIDDYDPYWSNKLIVENIQLERQNYIEQKLNSKLVGIIEHYRVLFRTIFANIMAELVAVKQYNRYTREVIKKLIIEYLD